MRVASLGSLVVACLTLAGCSTPTGAEPASAGSGSGASSIGAAAAAGASAGGASSAGASAAAGGVPAGGTLSGGGATSGGAGASSSGAAASAGGGEPFEGAAAAAVTLTYDDGLDAHLAVVQPALEAAGLRGTFFLSSFEGVDHDWALPNASSALTPRHLAWQAAGQRGHELAGHTVNHPCNAPGKTPGYRLTDYDSERMAAELDDNVVRLARLGAPAPFTFAYPCASDTAGLGASGSDYSALIAARFLGARVSTSEIVDPRVVDLQRVAQLDGGGKTGDELRALVDQAIAGRGWLVLLFHGVGEEQSCAGLTYAPESCMINYLVTSEAAHASLVAYLVEQRARVWTAPFKTVAERLAARLPPP